MENMAYGRGSLSDVAVLQSEVGTRISRAKKELKGNAYNTLITTIKKSWSGQDAEKFLKILDEIVTELTDDYQKLGNEINYKIGAEWNSYTKEGQGKIANSIVR